MSIQTVYVGLVAVAPLLLLTICYCFCRAHGDDEDTEAGQPRKARNTTKLPVMSQQSLPKQETIQIHQGRTDRGKHSKKGSLKSLCTHLKSYTYNELVEYTKGFSQGNLLGEGSFGQVYRGKFTTGETVAIKKLKNKVGQKEFEAELLAISRVHHKHLVKIIGYCDDKAGNRLLVYEFVPNDSLGFHLYGRQTQILSWPNRMKIALGSAKGLEYLHQGCDPMMIHRDVKADNILLDKNFGPKIADFGLAKEISSSVSHVTTDARGTFGYLAPECIQDRRLTDKSDVYSFGVLLLELITGRKHVFYEEDPGQERRAINLAQWLVPQIKEAMLLCQYGSLVDPKLEGNIDAKELEKMIYCATASVYKPAKDRPDMMQIVRALEGNIPLKNIWSETDSNYLCEGAPYSAVAQQGNQ